LLQSQLNIVGLCGQILILEDRGKGVVALQSAQCLNDQHQAVTGAIGTADQIPFALCFVLISLDQSGGR